MLKTLDGYLQWLSFAPPFLARMVLGFGFYLTGSGKLAHLDRFSEFLSSLGVPFASLQAPLIAGLEFGGGILLLLGLATRPIAFLLSGTMAVALLTADRMRFVESWSRSSDIVPTDVTAFAYLLLLSWLVVYGAGAVSLDRLLARQWTFAPPQPSSVLG